MWDDTGLTISHIECERQSTYVGRVWILVEKSLRALPAPGFIGYFLPSD
jgi:hypothetical protein